MSPWHACELMHRLQGTESRIIRMMKTSEKKNRITDISRTIANFITRSGSYVLKVCLKRNTDLVETVKQSNSKDVPKCKHDKNRSDLSKRRESLNCDVAIDIEMCVTDCFTLTYFIKK